jgi:hypothetical protein
MSDVRVPGEGMSWADVWELRRGRRRDWEKGIYRPPPRQRDEEGGYSYQEVMEEVRLIVADTARFLSEDPGSGIDALAAAGDVASVRDDNRLRAHRQVPLGEFSMLFARWLMRRADRGDFAAAVGAARLAANGSPERHMLGEELRGFVSGYLDGSISPEQASRWWKHPRPALTRLAQMSKVADDPVASAAASTLSGILAELRSQRSVAPALVVWEAFKRFAALPVAPQAPESLDEQGDLLLFEWGLHDEPSSDEPQQAFFVDLVRQFSILAEDGEYEQMEQVHCRMWFARSPALRRLGSGTIWSDGDQRRWIAKVERSGCFAALQAASPPDVRVDHWRV